MLTSVTERGTLVVLLVFVVIGMTGVVLAQPTVTVSVDGEDVSEGETVRVTDDPTVDIEAEADSSIELVEVRVDGDIRETFEPGSKSFSESLTLDLDSGENDVQVIVNAEETTTFDATILKDGAGPLVEYTTPFQTPDRRPPPDSTTVRDANVTLSAKLYDDTGVETIEIERVFEYTFGGSSDQSVATHTIEDPGDEFEQELFLGDGENELTVRYTDEMGNVRVHEFILNVVDSERPTLDLSVPDRTGAPEVRLRGTVTDNVKVQTIAVDTPEGQTREILTESSPEPDPGRLSIELNEEIELNEGRNQIVVEATDNAGNSQSDTVTVVYDREVEPRVTVDADRTQFENGDLRVRGRVDRGEIDDVRLESIDRESEDRIDFVNVYSGETTSRVDIDETLGVGDGETQVRILVVDSEGDQHDETFTVDGDSERVYLDGGSPEERTPTPTATPTATSVATTPTSTPESQAVTPTPESQAVTPTPAADDDDGVGSEEDAPQAEDDDGGEEVEASAEGPGFTAVLALVALALVAARLAVRRS